MTDKILSKHNKPFKLKRHALNAIKGKKGYIVMETDKGFVGIKDTNTADSTAVDQGETKGIERTPPPLDVLCPGCGGSYHLTTAAFNPDIDANPAMLRLKKQYREWGWEELVADSSMGYGCLVCPECGAALAPSGRLRVK